MVWFLVTETDQKDMVTPKAWLRDGKRVKRAVIGEKRTVFYLVAITLRWFNKLITLINCWN